MADSLIRHYALQHEMIAPFVPKSTSALEDGRKVASYGLSTAGYDIRLGRNFIFYRGEENKIINFRRGDVWDSMVIPSLPKAIIDPNNFDPVLVVQIDDVDEIIIPPKTFFMGVSQEYIRVPRNVKVTCDGKSTCARSGLIFYVTPLEPGWMGFITLEFNNSNDALLRLLPGMGISQLEFKLLNTEPEIAYCDRNGKYQGQGPQPIPPKQHTPSE
jgi:dCTP deaminase